MKRKVFFPILALAIIGTAAATTTMVSAQDAIGANSIVAAVAAKFNLNQSDVQAVFDEQKTKHHAELKAAMDQKLTQAVTDGKITEAQKQAIITHFSEMKEKRVGPGQFKEMTGEERKAFHEQKQAEMDAWLSQNGLTREVLQDVMGHPKFGGRGMMFKTH